MKRTAVVIGAMLGGFISVLGLEEAIGVGGYSLSVSIRVLGPRVVKKATCCACSRAEDASEFIDLGPRAHQPTYRIDEDNPFTGRPLTVEVSVSTHSSLFGLKHRYYQLKYLAVIVEYQDGTRETKVVDILDGRKTRAVTVTVP